MYEQLHHLYEEMTNIEDFIDTIQKSPLVHTIKKHQSKNTELLNKKQALKDNPLHKLIKSFIRKFSYDKKHLNLFEYLETKEFEINSLKDLESYEEITEIVEITLEDCIAHEENIMRNYVRKDYLIRRCLDMDEGDYMEAQYQLDKPSELYLTALREYNRREVLLKRLMRRKNFKDLRMGDYLDMLNALVNAKNDDEIDDILRSIDKR